VILKAKTDKKNKNTHTRHALALTWHKNKKEQYEEKMRCQISATSRKGETRREKHQISVKNGEQSRRMDITYIR
jgi:hypothetical protein